MRNRLLAAILCGLMLLSMLPTASAAYTDVPADHWAAGEIAAATEAGLFQGVTADTFGLGKNMNRAQFVTALVRLMGWETVTPETPSFSDCTADAWYYEAVETAYANGALPTYSTTFRPYGAITREEMASMLVRALGLGTLAGQMTGAELPFTDVTSNKGYIAIAYDMGILQGYGDGTFRPKGLVTREQTAAVLMRAYTRMSSTSREVSKKDGYEVISVEIPEPTPETAIPTTPLESLPELYQALKTYFDNGGTAENAAVQLSEGGVATATRGSKIVSSRPISQREVEGYLSRSGVKTYYHDTSACAYLIYTSGTTQTTVWYQTEESLATKLALCCLFGITNYILEEL